jgi:hypothetical protein
MESLKLFVFFTAMHATAVLVKEKQCQKITEQVSANMYTKLNGPTGAQTEKLNFMMLMIIMKRRLENLNRK